MTENELKINGKSFSETISQIEEFMESDDVHGELFTVLRSARDFMENLNEEIQQYRAFGRVEEIQNMKDNGSFTGMELAQIAAMQMQLKDYQSIGTIEEFKALKNKHIGKDNMVISSSDLMKILNSDSEELKQYKEVGTVEEFKVLKEKSVAKKPHSISIANDIGNSMVECPICHARSDYDVKSIKRGYCWKCGQKLDWSE